MKVYVDELPKDCIECPFCQDIKVNAGMDRLLFCKANKGKAIKNIEKSFDKCIVKNEFQSLSDYTKQVRKEVIGQVRDIARKIARPTTEYDGGEFDYDIDGVTLGNLLIWLEDEEFDLLKNFLDQIQGE